MFFTVFKPEKISFTQLFNMIVVEYGELELVSLSI